MATHHARVTRCGGRELRWGDKTYVMGIINVTPDSFSGDGLGGQVERAIAQAKAFAAEGADILDVGAESTRPRAMPVDAGEELRRLMPVVRRLTAEVDLPVSVDTYKAEVAAEALAAGVSMLNDVWGLRRNRRLAELAAARGVPIVLMHNQQGTAYRDLIPDVLASLRWSVDQARSAGVPEENIIIDPGFGFGKTPEQNLEILRHLEEIKALGYPLLLGTSRKSAIGIVLDLPVDQRLEGTAATVALGIAGGVDIVRVHDVKAMARVARMADAIVRGWTAPR